MTRDALLAYYHAAETAELEERREAECREAHAARKHADKMADAAAYFDAIFERAAHVCDGTCYVYPLMPDGQRIAWHRPEKRCAQGSTGTDR